MSALDYRQTSSRLIEMIKDSTLQLLLWFLRRRAVMMDRRQSTQLLTTPQPAHNRQASEATTAEKLATVFLYSPYQRPYLIHLADSMRSLGFVRVCTYDMLQEARFVTRKLNEFKNHGVGFHSFPFQTHRFPSTLRHVLVNHGIDSGKYDSMGSFNFGPGRTLGRKRSRLYDFILVSSPWSQGLANSEVPEYRDRVLVCGDWRADAVLAAGRHTAPHRAALNIPPQARIVGIVSTHGRFSTMHRYGHQLFELLATGGEDTVFLIFFHEYERVQQKELYDALRHYCRHHDNVRIVESAQFESSLAVCDLLISDSGSTSLYYALLGRPMAYLPMDDSSMLPDYPTLTLRPHIHGISSLADSRSLIEELHSPGNGLLSPPAWFIERLYPRDVNYHEQSRRALQTVFSAL